MEKTKKKANIKETIATNVRIVSKWVNAVFYAFRLFFSNFHLLIARTMAKGKWSLFLLLFINVIVLTVLTAGALFFAYGELCLTGVTYEGNYEPVNVIDAAYYLLFTNGGQNMYKGSHLLGIAITSFGILFIAVLTSLFTNFFERIGQNYLSGESTFLMKGHIVIIGTSDVLYSILNSKKKEAGTRFLILSSRDIVQKRREVISFISEDINSNHIVFMYGDRTSEKDIDRLSLAYAKEVFIIGDSEESDSVESYRDSNNMDCVSLIANNTVVKKLRKGNQKLSCHVMFEYQTTFVAFQFSEMGDSFKENIDFRPFNFYDMWAQKVIVAGGEKNEKEGEQKYSFLDTLPGGYINKDSEESVHLIIIGITKMGIALGIQAAQVCHYPNFISNHSRRTRITFIDADADVEFNYLKGRYHSLFNNARHRIIDLSSGSKKLKKRWEHENSWLDVEWEFVKGRVESPAIQQYIEDICKDKNHVVTLAVCLTRSHQSIATAMFLPESVFQNCLQILVYQRLSGTIIDNVATPVNKKEQYRYSNIRPFGMIDCGYDPEFEENIFKRGKYIAYVYDSYYRTNPEGKGIKEWDDKLEKYDDAFNCWGPYPNYEDYWTKNKKVWEKLSCHLNALSLNTKLRSIGIMIQDESNYSFESIEKAVQGEIDNLKIVEHNRWNLEKLLTGYRTLSSDETRELKGLWKAWHNPILSEDEMEIAKKPWTDKRKQLKEWPYRAHLDICSFKTLQTCEEETILEHDIKLSSAIPYILLKEGRISNTDKKV